jgi:hypothetical protein
MPVIFFLSRFRSWWIHDHWDLLLSNCLSSTYSSITPPPAGDQFRRAKTQTKTGPRYSRGRLHHWLGADQVPKYIPRVIAAMS